MSAKAVFACAVALALAGCTSPPRPRAEASTPAPVQAAPVERVQQGGLAPPAGVAAAAPR
jgi:starvation-inducible outer membrane lipoprotein